MFGPMSARWRRLSDDPSRRAPEQHRCVGQAGPLCQWMGDRNEQYLLDHWCDCRRSCRIGLSWSSLTPQVRQEEGGAALKKWGGWLRARGPVGAPRPGPGAAEALGRKQRSTSATSGASSSDLRLVHPPTGLGRQAICRPSWACTIITMADGVVKHLTGFWGRMI